MIMKEEERRGIERIERKKERRKSSDNGQEQEDDDEEKEEELHKKRIMLGAIAIPTSISVAIAIAIAIAYITVYTFRVLGFIHLYAFRSITLFVAVEPVEALGHSCIIQTQISRLCNQSSFRTKSEPTDSRHCLLVTVKLRDTASRNNMPCISTYLVTVGLLRSAKR